MMSELCSLSLIYFLLFLLTFILLDQQFPINNQSYLLLNNKIKQIVCQDYQSIGLISSGNVDLNCVVVFGLEIF